MRNQGRPVQGASPWVPATPTGSFPQDRLGQVGGARTGNTLLTNTPDLTCSGRDGPTVPHRGRPRPAPTRQPVSVWRFTQETESHDAISAFRRGICQSHHLRWVFALHLRHEGPPQGAAASRTTTMVRAGRPRQPDGTRSPARPKGEDTDLRD